MTLAAPPVRNHVTKTEDASETWQRWFTQLRTTVNSTQTIVAGGLALPTYLVQVPNVAIANAQAISALSTGFLKGTAGTGVVTSVANVAQYTSGAWTPADASGAALVLTITNATYVKVGPLVLVQAELIYPVTTSTALASLNGLPFPSVAGANSVLAQGYGPTAITWLVRPASQTILPWFGPSTETQATNISLSNQTFIFSGCYQTAP